MRYEVMLLFSSLPICLGIVKYKRNSVALPHDTEAA